MLDRARPGKWRPNNYEMDFNGPVPLRIALEKSLNLVTVRVADQVGMEAVAQTAIAFHVVDNMPRVLPAALGAVETTVLREAGAYAGLAAGGREVVPTLIDSVQDRDGHVIWRAAGLDLPGLRRPAAPAGAGRRAQADGRSGQRVPAGHHDAGRGAARHRHRRPARGWTGRSPARPAPARTSTTPGSPASRPIS